jgi:D-xylose transport system substrate-binding protein
VREVRARGRAIWEDRMKSILKLMAGAAIIASMHSAAIAKDLVIGVSWSNFQEERWKTDEAAIKAVARSGGRQVSSRPTRRASAAEAGSPTSKALIAQGADVVLIVACAGLRRHSARRSRRSAAAGHSGRSATIACSSKIPSALYVTFDNVKAVGRLDGARGMLEAGQAGRQLRLHQGVVQGDPNADLPVRRAAAKS